MVQNLTLYKHLRHLFRDRQISWIFCDTNNEMCKFGRHSRVGMA